MLKNERFVKTLLTIDILNFEITKKLDAKKFKEITNNCEKTTFKTSYGICRCYKANSLRSNLEINLLN